MLLGISGADLGKRIPAAYATPSSENGKLQGEQDKAINDANNNLSLGNKLFVSEPEVSEPVCVLIVLVTFWFGLVCLLSVEKLRTRTNGKKLLI